jgi:hypothetical protein
MNTMSKAVRNAMLVAALALAASAAGAAADPRCMQSNQDRATCQREAAAAAADARRGRLDDGPADYRANALRRCEALPEADRDACRLRMTGHGTTSGSVEGGGIYREYIEIVAPTDVPPASAPR